MVRVLNHRRYALVYSMRRSAPANALQRCKACGSSDPRYLRNSLHIMAALSNTRTVGTWNKASLPLKCELVIGIISFVRSSKLQCLGSPLLKNPTQSLRLYRKLTSEWAGLVKGQATASATDFPRVELLSADHEWSQLHALLPFTLCRRAS